MNISITTKRTQLPYRPHLSRLGQVNIILLMIGLSFCTYGQDCRMVDSIVGKTTETEIQVGTVFSKDFHHLAIRKHLVSSDSVYFTLLLYGASRIVVPDSLLLATGDFVLSFLDKTTEVLIANWFNENVAGVGNTIGFHAEVKEAIVQKISKAPIVKIGTFGVLETEFSRRKQKQQQKIASCLLSKQ